MKLELAFAHVRINGDKLERVSQYGTYAQCCMATPTGAMNLPHGIQAFTLEASQNYPLVEEAMTLPPLGAETVALAAKLPEGFYTVRDGDITPAAVLARVQNQIDAGERARAEALLIQRMNGAEPAEPAEPAADTKTTARRK